MILKTKSNMRSLWLSDADLVPKHVGVCGGKFYWLTKKENWVSWSVFDIFGKLNHSDSSPQNTWTVTLFCILWFHVHQCEEFIMIELSLTDSLFALTLWPCRVKRWKNDQVLIVSPLTGLCGEAGIRCPEGTCLSAEERCDGQVHCSDGSDEPITCGRLDTDYWWKLLILDCNSISKLCDTVYCFWGSSCRSYLLY